MKKLLLGLISAVLIAGCHGGTQYSAKLGGFHSATKAHGALKSHKRPLGHTTAILFRHGKAIAHYDFGYGAVTNVGVTAMANDYAWAAPSGAAENVLALAKYVATGTGATAAAATDINLQTADGIASVTGAQSLVSAANAQAYRVVATQNYTGSEAVTEFALFTSPTLTASTGTPWTNGNATTGTATGTPYTASSSTVAGEQELIFLDTTKSPTIYGVCLTNTTSVVTVPAWYKTTDGTASGTFPANTDTLQIRPVMLDHKVFSAINVINGDSIQFTYTLTINSGG